MKIHKYVFLTISFFILQAHCFGLSKQLYKSNQYEIYSIDGKQGLKDEEGNILIPAKYDEIGWSRGAANVNNGVIGYRSGDLWGLVSIENDELTSGYTQLYVGSLGYIIAGKRGKVANRDYLGVISTEGKQLLPFKYASINIAEMRAIVGVKYNQHYVYGLVDMSDREVIPLTYSRIIPLGPMRFAVENGEGKTAIFTDKGKRIIGFKLDSISAYRGEYAMIYNGATRGLIDRNGRVILQPEYQQIWIRGDRVEAKKFNHWQILTGNHKVIHEFTADAVSPFSKDLLKLENNGLVTLVQKDGSAVTEEYQTIQPLQGSLTAFRNRSLWGVLNNRGQIKIAAQYDSAVIDKDLIYVLGTFEGRYGWSVYDSFNVKKTETVYEKIGSKTAHWLPVKKRGSWGFINREGEEVIHCVYDEVGRFVKGLVPVKFHGERGIINKQGDWVVLPHKAQEIIILDSNFYITRTAGLKKLMNYDGELIYFTENDLSVKDGYLLEHLSDGGIWKVDFEGRIVEQASDESYEEVMPPSEGFYAIKKDGRFGFIDSQNRLRIANRYEDVGSFKQGLAAFKLLGRWGFMNKREQIVIQPIYKKVSGFKSGLAIVYTERGAGLIDVSGKEISSFNFDSLQLQENDRFLTYRNGKVGLLSGDGQVVINSKYQSLTDLDNSYIIVKQFDKFGLISPDGVSTIPLVYDKLIYDPRGDCYLGMKKSVREKVDLQ